MHPYHHADQHLAQGEEGNDANPKLLAMTLARCLDAAQERDAAIFCLSDLLAAVPRESLEVNSITLCVCGAIRMPARPQAPNSTP